MRCPCFLATTCLSLISIAMLAYQGYTQSSIDQRREELISEEQVQGSAQGVRRPYSRIPERLVLQRGPQPNCKRRVLPQGTWWTRRLTPFHYKLSGVLAVDSGEGVASAFGPACSSRATACNLCAGKAWYSTAHRPKTHRGRYTSHTARARAVFAATSKLHGRQVTRTANVA